MAPEGLPQAQASASFDSMWMGMDWSSALLASESPGAWSLLQHCLCDCACARGCGRILTQVKPFIFFLLGTVTRS